MTRLFIGNVPPGTTEDDLRAVFEAHGRVGSATIVIDHFKGHSHGRFGYVDMPDRKRAGAAMEELNGLDVRGHRLEVCEAGSWNEDTLSLPLDSDRAGRGSRQVA